MQIENPFSKGGGAHFKILFMRCTSEGALNRGLAHSKKNTVVFFVPRQVTSLEIQ